MMRNRISCMQMVNHALIMMAVAGITLVGSAMFATTAHAVVVTIINGDGPGEGFNDPTPFTPAGGNNATTLGQARLNAFQHAADIWGAQITSTVPIVVFAQMNPLGGSAGGATLGFAGATRLHQGFANAPFPNTWYPTPLANKLAGVDLTVGTPNDPVSPSEDIDATFNSDVDGNIVLGTIHWYYGFDSLPPTGPGNGQPDEDFVSVVLHEIGHGLGFSAEVRIDSVNGLVTKTSGFDGAFMRNVEHHAVGMFPVLTDAQRFAAVTSVNALHFTGSSTVAARGAHAELFAPATVSSGSTLSHFDETTLPLELMSPFASGPQHNVGMAANVLQDIGWGFVGTQPSIAVSLNAASFTRANGPTMIVTVATTASVPAVPAVLADQYVALQLPDGSFLIRQANGSFSPAIAPMVSNQAVPTLSSVLLNYTFTGAEPPGTYTWFVGLATPGTLTFIGAVPFASFTVL